MKISLIGFMGSGKTSVAKILSKKLELKNIEMDDLVLKKSKRKNISEIFAKDGEVRFREIEIEAAKDLRILRNVIVSAGGGVVMNKLNIDYLRENGEIIFLKTSFETIRKRLKNDISRPLFKNIGVAKKLFLFREGLYKEYADLIINTDNLSIEEVANSLIKLL